MTGNFRLQFKLAAVFILIIAAAGISPIFAQIPATSGNIVGTVTDESGSPLPGVMISSVPANGSFKTTVTNVEGHFRFELLPPGTYQVEAQLEGFKTVIRKNVEVTARQTTRLELTMQLAISS